MGNFVNVNRQANYILLATVHLLFIFAGYFLLKTIFQQNTKKPEPGFVIVEPRSTRLSPSAANGKELFMSKCASCHAIFKDMTGPGMMGFENRGPWSDRKNVYEWVRNPSAFMAKNAYARSLNKQYGSMMTAFPELTDEQIDAICDFIRETATLEVGQSIAQFKDGLGI